MGACPLPCDAVENPRAGCSPLQQRRQRASASPRARSVFALRSAARWPPAGLISQSNRRPCNDKLTILPSAELSRGPPWSRSPPKRRCPGGQDLEAFEVVWLPIARVIATGAAREQQDPQLLRSCSTCVQRNPWRTGHRKGIGYDVIRFPPCRTSSARPLRDRDCRPACPRAATFEPIGSPGLWACRQHLYLARGRRWWRRWWKLVPRRTPIFRRPPP